MRGCLCSNPKMLTQSWAGGVWEGGSSPQGSFCKSLRISRSLNNSDKMSVTMATRENKLVGEVSDVGNA